MSKITYEDKVAIDVNAEVANINKVRAEDMNEIKQVVNNNDDTLSGATNDISNLTGRVGTLEDTTSSQGQRITTLEGTVESQGTQITNQGNQITAQQAQINDMNTIFNALPTVNGVGTELSLTDTADSILKSIILKGNGGKNLLNKNDCVGRYLTSETILDTGVRVTLTDTARSAYSGYKIGGSELLGKAITIKSNVTASSSNNAAIRVFFGRSGRIYDQLVASYNLSELNNPVTVTLPSSFNEGNDSVYILLYCIFGTIDFEAGVYADFTDLQIELGSSATSYEPYGASVTGNNTIYSNTKNLINIQNCTKGFISSDGSAYTSGVSDFTINENSITFTATASYRGLNTDFIPLFTTNHKLTYTTDNNDIGVLVAYYDKNKTFISRTNASINYDSKPANAMFCRYNIVLNSAGTATISNIQLESGTTATPYQKGKNANYPVNLGTTKMQTGDTIQGTIGNWSILRANGTSETITDETLITQLNNIKSTASSYSPQTDINQINADLGFNLDITAYKDLNLILQTLSESIGS